MIVEGSIPGPYHTPEGNEDAAGHATVGRYTVVAVSDGAGSLPHSGQGARLAVSTVVDVAVAHLTQGDAPSDVITASVATARETLMACEQWRTMGCTLAVAILCADRCTVGVVGDAFAVVSTVDGTHHMVHRPPDGEYPNITTLLTSRDPDPLVCTVDGPCKAVSVSSDGLAAMCLSPDGAALPGFWDPLVSRAAAGTLDVPAFLTYLRAKNRIVDDTTLVMGVVDTPPENITDPPCTGGDRPEPLP